jgi:hypothetical protein
MEFRNTFLKALQKLTPYLFKMLFFQQHLSNLIFWSQFPRLEYMC